MLFHHRECFVHRLFGSGVQNDFISKEKMASC